MVSLVHPRREQLPSLYHDELRKIAGNIMKALPKNFRREDLISAGYVGLFEAYSRYDSSMGVEFWSYAQYRVRGAMIDECRRQSEGYNQWTHQIIKAVEGCGSDAERVQVFGVSERVIGRTKRINVISLNRLVNNEGEFDVENHSLYGLPADEILIRTYDNLFLQRALETVQLTRQEQDVYDALKADKSVTEIADEWRVTHPHISHLKTSIVKKVQKRYREIERSKN